jgi:hypothetical protein
MSIVFHIGPGVWELRAKKTARDSKHKVTTTVKAIPTPTHMMLVKLHEVCKLLMLHYMLPLI